MKSAPIGNFCMREPRAGIDREALNNFAAGKRAPFIVLLLVRVRDHQETPVMSHGRLGNRDWFTDRRSLPLTRAVSDSDEPAAPGAQAQEPLRRDDDTAAMGYSPHWNDSIAAKGEGCMVRTN